MNTKNTTQCIALKIICIITIETSRKTQVDHDETSKTHKKKNIYSVYETETGSTNSKVYIK